MGDSKIYPIDTTQNVEISIIFLPSCFLLVILKVNLTLLSNILQWRES